MFHKFWNTFSPSEYWNRLFLYIQAKGASWLAQVIRIKIFSHCLLNNRALTTDLPLPSAKFNQETPSDVSNAAQPKNIIAIYNTSTTWYNNSYCRDESHYTANMTWPKLDFHFLSKINFSNRNKHQAYFTILLPFKNFLHPTSISRKNLKIDITKSTLAQVSQQKHYNARQCYNANTSRQRKQEVSFWNLYKYLQYIYRKWICVFTTKSTEVCDICLCLDWHCNFIYLHRCWFLLTS